MASVRRVKSHTMGRNKLDQLMRCLGEGRSIRCTKKSLSGRALESAKQCRLVGDRNPEQMYLAIYYRALDVEKEDCERGRFYVDPRFDP